MKYILILLVFLLFFLIEFFLFNGRKKELFIYICRYIFINIVLFYFVINIYNKNFDFYLMIIFIVKIIVDKLLVFKKIEFKLTNWEIYYKKKPLKIVTKKRENNINYILNILKEAHFKNFLNVLEYGGGNSRVAEAISKKYNIKKFTIVDNNEWGIKLLKERKIKNLNSQCISIFDYEDENNYDLIYSIGLIEHFQDKNLTKCIQEHFKLVKNKSYVLFTFPIPTLRYKFIRFIYELFDKWQYTDETPLTNSKVEKLVSKYGKIIYNGINKELILPQGVILVMKENK